MEENQSGLVENASQIVPPSIEVEDKNDEVKEAQAPTTVAKEADQLPPKSLLGKGVCPVKQEYIRPCPPRRSLEADGKGRGMNKGAEREHVAIQGTKAPTFEGEVNFVMKVMSNVKAAIRQKKAGGEKRKREEVPQHDKDNDTKAAGGEEGVSSPVKEEKATDDTEAKTDDTFKEVRDANKSVAASSTAATDKEDEHPIARRKRLFANKLVVAPLTTVGNLPFRRVCKGFGADVTISEMAMVFNLNKMGLSEWALLRRHQSEDIFGLQLAVRSPDDAVIAARALEASQFSYDFIDINCGCPVDLIVGRGCGCGLLERKGRLREIVTTFTKHQKKPVTIKCRIGNDEDSPFLHKYVPEFESWGAAATTIHGRSRKQRYTKLANWDYVDQCAQLTNLPVIGNGDIMSIEDILQHEEKSPHVTSYMIGRGALIKPWIFQEIKQRQTIDISSHERFQMLQDFCKMGLAHWGADEKGIANTRRFLLEWLSFLCRYVPVGLLERTPQRMNDRPPYFIGRDDMETLMASTSVEDWVSLSEMLLGPVGPTFKFTPKHKSNSYSISLDGAPVKDASRYDDE